MIKNQLHCSILWRKTCNLLVYFIFYTPHIIEKDGIILIFGAFIPLNCVDDFHRRSFLNFQPFLFKQSRFELTLVLLLWYTTYHLPRPSPRPLLARYCYSYLARLLCGLAAFDRLGRGRRLLVSLFLRLRWRRRWDDTSELTWHVLSLGWPPSSSLLSRHPCWPAT